MIFLVQSGQCVVERQEIVRRSFNRQSRVVEANSLPSAAVFDSLLAAGVVDEDSSHRLGGGGEEVPPRIPARGLHAADELNVSVVNQSRGLQSLPGLLVDQLLRGQLAQFVVDERQELLGGLWIALIDGGQDASDFIHRGRHS